jgi:RNA polymerase sigma-70 factor (ECF subfamily)
MPETTGRTVLPERDDSRELELLSRVQRGDRAAFSKLYKQYHPRLYGYLLRFLSNPAMAEEVLDDVMFVVWKDARKFQRKAAVSTWIFGIAYRKALTAIRADRRYQSGLDRKADVDAMAGALPKHAEWLRAGLLQLSPDHRQVLELTYYGGFSYQEIAQIAGCPVNTVKTRMFHARRRLKVLLPRLAGQTQEQHRERS